MPWFGLGRSQNCNQRPRSGHTHSFHNVDITCLGHEPILLHGCQFPLELNLLDQHVKQRTDLVTVHASQCYEWFWPWPWTFMSNHVRLRLLRSFPIWDSCLMIRNSFRLTITASCPMDLQYFPMDRQLCYIEIESCK